MFEVLKYQPTISNFIFLPQLVSMELIFFLAMTMHQDIQQRAQAEIDAVVGSNRLPTFEDLHDLPYVHAIMKETLRWQAVAPSSTSFRVLPQFCVK
jgi:cytochrome P450